MAVLRFILCLRLYLVAFQFLLSCPFLLARREFDLKPSSALRDTCEGLPVRELVGTFGRVGNQMLCLTNSFPRTPKDFALYVKHFVSSKESVDTRRYFSFFKLHKQGFCIHFEGDNTHRSSCLKFPGLRGSRNKRRRTTTTCLPARKAFFHKSISSAATTLPLGYQHEAFFGGLEWNTEFSRRCQEAFRSTGLIIEEMATIHLRHMEGLLSCDDQTRQHRPLREWSEHLGYHKNSVQWWCPYRAEEALDLLSYEGFQPQEVYVASDHQQEENEEYFKAFGAHLNTVVYDAYKTKMHTDGKAVSDLDEVWLDVWAMSHSKYLLGHPSSSLSFIAYKLNEMRRRSNESYSEGRHFAFPFQPKSLICWNHTGVAVKGPNTTFDMDNKARRRARKLGHKSAITHDNSLRTTTQRTVFSSINSF